MIHLLQKALRDLMKFMRKNAMYIIPSLLVIGVVLYLLSMRMEQFRFKMPMLDLEKDCSDYGYVCRRSSYMKEPVLIQKCYGGSIEGTHFYYKYMVGDKIITSGLYNDYLIHTPGSIMRFSDDKLYRLVSLDPTMKPPNCRIDNESTYDYTQSNIGGSY